MMMILFALSVISLALHSSAAVTSSPSAADGKTFDYIVVGAGLAGTTVAARLAENPDVTVLLVEAGSDDRRDPRVFDIYKYGEAFNTKLDWQWPTEHGNMVR